MPTWVFAGELSPEAERRYGADNCWKQWCLSHWGCSRNALFPERSSEEYDGGDTIMFFTEDMPVYLAHSLTKCLADVRRNGTIPYLGPGGKSQVTVECRDGALFQVDTVAISAQLIISKEMAGSKDDELNRTYIDKLVQRENEIERTIFVESDDYEVQSVKNCAISYIETVVICSIDEDYAEFISEYSE